MSAATDSGTNGEAAQTDVDTTKAALYSGILFGFLAGVGGALIAQSFTGCPGFPCRTYPLGALPAWPGVLTSGWAVLAVGAGVTLFAAWYLARLLRNRNDLDDVLADEWGADA